jgi:hypothetical protein
MLPLIAEESLSGSNSLSLPAPENLNRDKKRCLEKIHQILLKTHKKLEKNLQILLYKYNARLKYPTSAPVAPT